jgi:hypothetical protein
MELAKSKRQEGLKAQGVGRALRIQPFVASDGTQISFVDRKDEGGFFIVCREGKLIKEIRESTFRDRYWPRAK